MVSKRILSGKEYRFWHITLYIYIYIYTLLYTKRWLLTLLMTGPHTTLYTDSSLLFLRSAGCLCGPLTLSSYDYCYSSLSLLSGAALDIRRPTIHSTWQVELKVAHEAVHESRDSEEEIKTSDVMEWLCKFKPERSFAYC